MSREQLEFRISQYVDNTLSASERVALEAELERDGEARELLSQYRGLNDLLRAEMGLPELNWDRLSDQISAAVADQEIPALRLRIGWVAGLALAASVLIAVGIGIVAYVKGTSGPVNQPAPTIAKIEGPSAEAATQPALVRIDVGPGTDVAEAQYQLSEGIVYQPSSVRLIARDQEAGQDTHRSPYQQ